MPLPSARDGDDDVAVAVDLRALPREHERRRVELLDDGRARDRVAGEEPRALVDRRLDEAALLLEVHLAARGRRRRRLAVARGDLLEPRVREGADGGDAEVDQIDAH